jgi:hypothetical protein
MPSSLLAQNLSQDADEETLPFCSVDTTSISSFMTWDRFDPHCQHRCRSAAWVHLRHLQSEAGSYSARSSAMSSKCRVTRGMVAPPVCLFLCVQRDELRSHRICTADRSPYLQANFPIILPVNEATFTTQTHSIEDWTEILSTKHGDQHSSIASNIEPRDEHGQSGYKIIYEYTHTPTKPQRARSLSSEIVKVRVVVWFTSTSRRKSTTNAESLGRRTNPMVERWNN